MKSWCRQHLVITVTAGANSPREYVVPRPFAIVGSHPQADLVLPESDQPARAIYIHATDNGLYYRVLEMKLGTVATNKFMRLNPTDELELGNTCFRVRCEPSDVMEVLPTQTDAEALPIPILNIMYGDQPSVTRRLQFAFQTVGNHAQSDIRLESADVLPNQCLLFWYQHRLWCIDFCSGGSTLLNGQPIQYEEVNRGDILEVGKYLIQYQKAALKKVSGNGTPTAPPSTAPRVAAKNVEPQPAVEAPPPKSGPTISLPQGAEHTEPLAKASEAGSVMLEPVPSPEPSTTPPAELETTPAVVSFEPIHIQYKLAADELLPLAASALTNSSAQQLEELRAEHEALQARFLEMHNGLRQLEEQFQIERTRAQSLQAALEGEQARSLQFAAELSNQQAVWQTQLSQTQSVAEEMQKVFTEKLAQLQTEREQQQSQTTAQTKEFSTLVQFLQAESAKLSQERQDIAVERDRIAQAAALEREQYAHSLAQQTQAWLDQQTDLAKNSLLVSTLATDVANLIASLKSQEESHENRSQQWSEEWCVTSQQLQTELTELQQHKTAALALVAQQQAASAQDQQAILDQQRELLAQASVQLAHAQETQSAAENVRVQLESALLKFEEHQQTAQSTLQSTVAETLETGRELKRQWEAREQAWQSDQTLAAAERAQWREEIVKVVADRQYFREFTSQLELQSGKAVVELTQLANALRETIQHEFEQLKISHQQQLSADTQTALAGLDTWKQEIAAQALEGNWREAWSQLQGEWAAHQFVFHELRDSIEQLRHQSEAERQEVRSQWQVVAGDMELLSHNMKRKWKDLLKRQQTAIQEATQYQSDVLQAKQEINQQQQALAAIQTQIGQEIQKSTQERVRFSQQWTTLLHGISLLGRQLVGESIPTSNSHSLESPVESLAALEIKAIDSPTLQEESVEMRELRQQLVNTQQQAEQLKSTLAEALAQFSQDRENAKQQWGQMSSALHKLGQHHREQVKKLKDQRQAILEEHDKTSHEKAALFETMTQQSNHIAVLQQELEQLRAALHDQIQSLPN